MGILGCLLTDPSKAFHELLTLSGKFDPEMFYDLRHQALFVILVEMNDAREPIDLLTVHVRLKAAGQLEAVGGLTFLNRAMEIPSAANLPFYFEEVREKHRARRVIQACTAAVAALYEGGETSDEALGKLEAELLKTRDDSGGRSEFVTGKELAGMVVERIEREWTGEVQGIMSGIADLDRETCGWIAGEMVIIAGRPGNGKSAIAAQIAIHNAIELGIPVGIFSVEMMAVAIGIRMASNLADVDTRASRERRLTERDFARLTQATTRIAGSNLIIDDSSDLDSRSLRAKARRMVHEHKVKLIIVDYVQLVEGVSKRQSDNRQNQVAEVSSQIKAMAKELKIPVIALSQLNRESAKREGVKPRMEDLKESGQLEQDATFIGLLYRPTFDEAEAEKENRRGVCRLNMHIAKQRDGEAGGDVEMTFMKRTQRITGAAKVSDEDIPR